MCKVWYQWKYRTRTSSYTDGKAGKYVSIHINCVSIVTPISTVVAGEDYAVITEPVTVTFTVESPPAPPSLSECFSIEILDDNVDY